MTENEWSFLACSIDFQLGKAANITCFFDQEVLYRSPAALFSNATFNWSYLNVNTEPINSSDPPSPLQIQMKNIWYWPDKYFIPEEVSAMYSQYWYPKGRHFYPVKPSIPYTLGPIRH